MVACGFIRSSVAIIIISSCFLPFFCSVGGILFLFLVLL